MQIVPENVLSLFLVYQEALEQWFSERLYAQMLRRNPNHILVQIAARLDWSAIEAGCAAFHHQTGPGAKPKHLIRHLVRAVLVKALYPGSLRETQARIHNDLVVKWFVGYGVMAAVMDYSLLCRFELWLIAHQPRLFFDSVLTQLDAALPEAHQTLQIGDTFAMEANAGREGWVGLLRHLSRNLLRELEQVDPQGHAQVLAQLDLPRLFGLPAEPNSYYLSEEALQARLADCVGAALQLADRVPPPPAGDPPTALERLAADVRQVVRDNLAVARAADEQISAVTPLPEEQRGTFQQVSATDRDATIRNHGHSRILGYNINLLIDPRGFIREIFAATGAQPDASGIPTLVQRQKEHRGICPDKLAYDRAGSAGHTRAQVRRVSGGRTQLVARLAAPTQGDRFGPTAFHLSDDGQALTCPAGQTTTRVDLAPDRYGRIFAFHARQHCAACPLWSQCRNPKNKAEGRRTVFISDYRAELQAAQVYNQSAAFRREMQLRPFVERIIFMLTHYDGARRAQGRGTPRADGQVKMAATARNLRSWMKALLPRGAGALTAERR